MAFSSGLKTEVCSEGGIDVTSINNGDYIKVRSVDFGSGVTSFAARVASSGNGGTIELHIDSRTGPMIGSCAVTGTGGNQTWMTSTCTASGATGVHDLFLKFTGVGQRQPSSTSTGGNSAAPAPATVRPTGARPWGQAARRGGRFRGRWREDGHGRRRGRAFGVRREGRGRRRHPDHRHGRRRERRPSRDDGRNGRRFAGGSRCRVRVLVSERPGRRAGLVARRGRARASRPAAAPSSPPGVAVEMFRTHAQWTHLQSGRAGGPRSLRVLAGHPRQRCEVWLDPSGTCLGRHQSFARVVVQK